MSIQLSEALCQKVTNITNKYIKDYPVEWINFCKQQKVMRNNLRTKWAELPKTDMVVREILQMPETLFTLLKMGMSEVEYLEWTEERYKFWFGNRFPDFKSTEERL